MNSTNTFKLFSCTPNRSKVVIEKKKTKKKKTVERAK